MLETNPLLEPESQESVSETGENPLRIEEGAEVFPWDDQSKVSLNPELRLNLDDCVAMALRNNREIKAKGYELENAEWKLREAQPKGIPTFEYEFLSAPAPRNVDKAVTSFFSGDITYFQRGKIGLGIPLYAFGKIGIAQSLARGGIAAEKEKTLQKQNEILSQVRKLYYGMLFAKDLRDLLRDAVRHLESEIDRREHAQENSEDPVDPVEMVRLKLYRYEVISQLSKVEKKDYLAKEGLRVQMGLPRNVDFGVTEEHLVPVPYTLKSFDYYLNLSQKFRPESRLLNIGLKAKEDQYRLEKRQITPNIGFGAYYEFGRTTNEITGLTLTDDFNNPFNFNQAGLGIRVKGEISPRKYLSKVRQAQAEYFQVAFNKEAADDGLELDLKDAYLTLQQEAKNVENSSQAMKTARQFVFITKTNIDIGVGDKKDYSDALQAYLLSQGRYLESVFNYNVAVATLEQKSGGLGVINPLEEKNQ